MTASRIATITYEDDLFFVFIGTADGDGAMLGSYATLLTAASALKKYANGAAIIRDSMKRHACYYCGLHAVIGVCVEPDSPVKFYACDLHAEDAERRGMVLVYAAPRATKLGTPLL